MKYLPLIELFTVNNNNLPLIELMKLALMKFSVNEIIYH